MVVPTRTRRTVPPGSMYPGMMLGGRYRLDDLLSEHAGARFWRATDTVLARSVGVHAVVSDDPRAELVLEAARRSALVSDPHFLRVLDCDETAGLTWVVNEWGEGESLDLMLLTAPLPPARAAWLAREVAESIVAAHAAGVPHGRISPEAVMVTKSGAVKVIGFVVYAAIAGPRPVDPTYGDIDEREADVVDLAGILYAALTGRWPGIAPSAVPPAPREGGRPLRPRQVRAGVPRTLDAICDRVLTKEATQHAAPIESAYEILAALNDYVGDPTMAAPPDLPAMHDDPALVPGSLPEPVPAVALAAAIPAIDEEPAPEPEPVPLVEQVESPRPGSGPDPVSVSGPAALAHSVTGDPEATMAAPMVLDETMPRVYDGVLPEDLILGEDRDPVPPPPPFEETPDRPLFADHDRRVPATASTVAPGAPGSPTWPFDEEDGPSAGGAPGDAGPRRGRRTALIVAGLVLLAAVMYGAFLLGQDDGTPSASADPTPTLTPSPAPVTGTPVKVVKATDFDPEGDPPAENPNQAKLAIDGDPATGWQTEKYRTAPLGGLKSGVGLLLDLGTQQTISSIDLVITGVPTGFEVYVTPPGVDDAPAELADARRVTGLTAEVTNPVMRLEPAVQTRFVLIWLTKVPPVSGGFRGEVNEVMVRP